MSDPTHTDREAKPLVERQYDRIWVNGGEYVSWPKMVDTVMALNKELSQAKELESAWSWLAEHPSLELAWGAEPEEEPAWFVHRVRGGRSDLERELIATGETPLAAVQAARSTLSQESSDER